jgi:hypothetical protein
MKKVLLWILLLAAVGAKAQTEPEYRLELGGGVGLLTYLGDFNTNLMKNTQPMFSLLAKYKFDPRQALALNVSYGTLKGSAKYEKSYYPNIQEDYSFKNNVLDVGLRYEYNFWPYGTGEEYRGAKRLTPYIYIGLGITACKAGKTEMGVNLPVGAGVKYKAADRVNVALEWTMHFTSNDRLDGIEDPYGIKRSGLFKNTDCYSHLRLSLTYDLWAKCKTCHNDRD